MTNREAVTVGSGPLTVVGGSGLPTICRAFGWNDYGNPLAESGVRASVKPSKLSPQWPSSTERSGFPPNLMTEQTRS